MCEGDANDFQLYRPDEHGLTPEVEKQIGEAGVPWMSRLPKKRSPVTDPAPGANLSAGGGAFGP